MAGATRAVCLEKSVKHAVCTRFHFRKALERHEPLHSVLQEILHKLLEQR